MVSDIAAQVLSWNPRHSEDFPRSCWVFPEAKKKPFRRNGFGIRGASSLLESSSFKTFPTQPAAAFPQKRKGNLSAGMVSKYAAQVLLESPSFGRFSMQPLCFPRSKKETLPEFAAQVLSWNIRKIGIFPTQPRCFPRSGKETFLPKWLTFSCKLSSKFKIKSH